MTGYSGMPLAAKLGIKPGMAMRAVNAPQNYLELLAPLPDGARLARALRSYRMPTDITEDTIRVKLVVRKELR